MRELPIYPQQFGSGIPNPIGPATFRGVEKAKKGWVTLLFKILIKLLSKELASHQKTGDH